MPPEVLRPVAVATRKALRLEPLTLLASLAVAGFLASPARTSRTAAMAVLMTGLVLVLHGRSLRTSERLLRLTDPEPPPSWVPWAAWFSILAGAAITLGAVTLLLGLCRVTP